MIDERFNIMKTLFNRMAARLALGGAGQVTSTLLLLAPVSSAVAAVRYVDANSPGSAPPYTNWATAARVIQDAVDAAAPGDEIVVANRIYATGGRSVGTNLLVNRVALDKPLTVRSVNGPQFTGIQGYQRRERERHLAERGWSGLFPGAQHGPVGDPALHAAGRRHSRPAQHNGLHRHDRGKPGTAVLSRGSACKVQTRSRAAIFRVDFSMRQTKLLAWLKKV